MGGPINSSSSSVDLQDKESGDSADIISTDGFKGLVTVTPGHVSTDNSTTETLNAGISFAGEWEDISNFGVIVISVTSNVASATDGLVVQFSSDGTVPGIISDDQFTLAGGAKKTWSFQAAAAYFRVVFTNGGADQLSFNLQTVLKPYYVKPSSHRIQDPIIGDDDAELVKAVITGESPDGIFRNVKTNAEQAISVTNFLVEVSRGNIPGMKLYNIPGRKDTISSTVLDDLTQIPATTVVPEPGGIQLQVVSSHVGDISGGAGIQELDIHYLDTAGLEQEEMITMDGQDPVNTIATDIDFVQWAHARAVGANGVALGNISITDTTPTVAYEYIAAGGNQSLSGRVKVPVDKTGFVMGWQATGVTKKIDIRLRATVERFDRSLLPGVFLFQDNLLLNDSTSGWIPFDAPLKMPSLAVVKMSGISFVAGGDAGGAFTILLIDNP